MKLYIINFYTAITNKTLFFLSYLLLQLCIKSLIKKVFYEIDFINS